RNASEARVWLDRLFSYYVLTLNDADFSISGRLRAIASIMLKGRSRLARSTGLEPNTGYILLQEFLSNNKFDTRVTVIGNRAFAYRRFNRPNDFRASGSGNFDV